MNNIGELLERKRSEVELRKRSATFVPDDDRRVEWSKKEFRMFAEIKRASLSAGEIRSDLTPATLARSYERAGVSAVSVLTERNYFKGSLEDLKEVRQSVKIPVLQKDFILDEFQIREAKAAGADFVLLIAKFLSAAQLEGMLQLCELIRMNSIVEITNEADLARLPATPRFLGVNSRDLETLQVDVRKFEQLRNKLPDSFLIAESGIQNLDTLRRVIDLGYNGVLIGEHLLRAKDPEKEAARFVQCAAQNGNNGRIGPRVKICGITNEADALAAVQAGADALGFIFAESPRKVDRAVLQQLRPKIPDRVACVGVFRGQNAQEISGAMKSFSLDVAQIYDPVTSDGVVWRAQNIDREIKSDFLLDERNTIIWDIKAEPESLPELWRQLKSRAGDVFALAGGLDPQNVTEAISICRPVWVDVARGVEREPGKKDLNKLAAFMNAVKNVRMKDEG